MREKKDWVESKIIYLCGLLKLKNENFILFVETVILIVIYLLSFLILALGRVQQTFLGVSGATFSIIQMGVLTLFFAMIITLIVHRTHKGGAK